MKRTQAACSSSVGTTRRCSPCSRRTAPPFVRAHSDHDGADVVLEVAGADSTFRLAWECARPNAVVTVVALYDKAQTLPLPEMYGKNLTFKTGGVDGCDCEETLRLIAEGKIDTEPLITPPTPCAGSQRATSCLKRNGTA